MEMKYLMLVLMIGLSLWTTTTECVEPTTVMIENKLSDRVSVLRVHCKSRDEDVGEQLLGPWDTYKFSFRPNVVRQSTIFSCVVSSLFGEATFDVYDLKRDRSSERCTRTCRWEVQDGAVVGFNEKTSKDDIRVPWKK